MDSSGVACASCDELVISCGSALPNLAELTCVFRGLDCDSSADFYPPAAQSGFILGMETRFPIKGVARCKAS